MHGGLRFVMDVDKLFAGDLKEFGIDQVVQRVLLMLYYSKWQLSYM